jgi:hypothetical protein
MKKDITTKLLTFLFILVAFQANAQVKKYKAISNVAGSDINGYAYLNLTGENKDMIKFEIEGTPTDSNHLFQLLGIAGKKDPKVSLSTGLVSSIIIGKDTFYRFDTEEGKDAMKNIFVKKLAGKGKPGLYSWTNKKNEVQYFVHLREDDPLSNLNNWISNYNIMSAFKSCATMKERLLDQFSEKRSPFDNITTTEGKAAVWKALIEEYEGCVKSK